MTEGMLADSVPFLFVKLSGSWAILDNKILVMILVKES